MILEKGKMYVINLLAIHKDGLREVNRGGKEIGKDFVIRKVWDVIDQSKESDMEVSNHSRGVKMKM